MSLSEKIYVYVLESGSVDPQNFRMTELIERMPPDSGTNYNHFTAALHSLTKRGAICRIKPGVYRINEDFKRIECPVCGVKSVFPFKHRNHVGKNFVRDICSSTCFERYKHDQKQRCEK